MTSANDWIYLRVRIGRNLEREDGSDDIKQTPVALPSGGVHYYRGTR